MVNSLRFSVIDFQPSTNSKAKPVTTTTVVSKQKYTTNVMTIIHNKPSVPSQGTEQQQKGTSPLARSTSSTSPSLPQQTVQLNTQKQPSPFPIVKWNFKKNPQNSSVTTNNVTLLNQPSPIPSKSSTTCSQLSAQSQLFEFSVTNPKKNIVFVQDKSQSLQRITKKKNKSQSLSVSPSSLCLQLVHSSTSSAPTCSPPPTPPIFVNYCQNLPTIARPHRTHISLSDILN